MQCIAADHVTAGQAHGRVAVRRLLSEDRTREQGVEAALVAQVDFDLNGERG